MKLAYSAYITEDLNVIKDAKALILYTDTEGAIL